MAKIRPLGDRVLIKPVEAEEQSKGGIIIPDTAREKPMEGVVKAVGGGIAFALAPGDLVLLPKYGGTELKFDGERYLLLREEDLIALIEN